MRVRITPSRLPNFLNKGYLFYLTSIFEGSSPSEGFILRGEIGIRTKLVILQIEKRITFIFIWSMGLHVVDVTLSRCSIRWDSYPYGPH